MRIAAVTAACISVFVGVTGAQPLQAAATAESSAPAAPASVETNANLRDFDFVTEKLRVNYAGWDTKVTDATRPKLEALTAKLRAEAATAAPERFTEILREWLAFFGDRHIGAFPLSVEQPSPAEAAAAATRTPSLDWTEASVRASVAELGERRDPLEGIWNISDRYRIGVLRTPGKEGMFTAVVLTTVAEGWSPGQVKAEFTRLKDDTIELMFRAGDHSEHRQLAKLLLDGAMLRSDRWGVWVREYPASAVPVSADMIARISPSDSMFLKPLSDGTMWLRLPDFDPSRLKPLKEILAAHEARLASCTNLLIDLRNNGGGSDFVYAPIMPMLYTRPIYGIGVELRATADNLALRKRVADELRTQEPEAAQSLDEQNARMERNLGGWIQHGTKPFDIERMDSVMPFPKRVAILIDGAGSSGEQFLLEARQSRKVTLFGQRNSLGVLDFANVVRMDTPSGRHGMYWATSRSLRLPDEPVDPDGIPPDIRIPMEVVDPVGFAQAWLERQVD